MVDVNTQNKTISINVSSSGVSSNVNASGDTAMYYSNKAKEWAISNRLIDGQYRSSKYYSEQAEQSAIEAEGAKELVLQAKDGVVAEVIQEGENQRENLQEETQNQILVLREVSDEEQDTITAIKNSIEQGKAVYIGDSEPIEDIFDIWVDPSDNDIYLDIKEVKEQLPNKQDILIAGDGIEIVDNVISAKGGSGHDIFDIVYKDHILSYEETQGFAPLGSYVYKTAIAGSRYGYVDFYNQCVQEYNEATTTETVNGVTVKVSSNGHKFYNIADKSAIDTFYSSYGMAWFYGIDTANERVFLPRNVFYFKNGSADNVGDIVEAGLPNITGTCSASGVGNVVEPNGAFYNSYNDTVLGGATVSYAVNGFDASLSNPIYGNSNTVQPPSVNLIPYMVVGNTTTQSAVTDVIDITTSENDTIPLYTGMYFDFTPNNASWIKANEQVASGGIYTTAYNDLVNELTTPKYNIKVVDVANMVTGVDYSEYWKVNQTDMTFTCPISTGERILIEKKEPTTDDSSWYNLYSDGWLEQGGTATTDSTVEFLKSFRDIQYVITLGKIIGGSDGIPRISAKTTNSFRYSSSNVANTHSDWQASGYAEIQTPTNFYFKVANAVQNLELLNVGEVLEAVNNVVPNNKSLISGYGMPSDKYITLYIGASGAQFTAPANGWFAGWTSTSTQSNIYFAMYTGTIDNGYGAEVYREGGASYQMPLILPVKKGTVITVNYTLGLSMFRFYYAEGEQ